MFQFAGGAFVALAADLQFDPFHFSTPRDMKLIFLLNYLLQGGLKDFYYYNETICLVGLSFPGCQ